MAGRTVQSSPLEAPSAPQYIMPLGACDTHCHFFGPSARFPYIESRTYEPAELPLERYELLMKQLGLSRSVFVQPAVWGRNHDAILDALERGQGRYSAVGLVDWRTDPAELARLDAAGVRGARFNLVGHLGSLPTSDDIERTVDLVTALGWHVLFHVDEAALVQNADFIANLHATVVIDHMARLSAAKGIGQPGFRVLLDLAAQKNVWVKISGADRMVTSTDHLAEAIPFMAQIAKVAPARTLWGTDWPHPNVAFMPDDGKIADLLMQAVPDEERRMDILVHNPSRLYFGRRTR